MITANEYLALKSWLEPWEVQVRLGRAVTGWPYKTPCNICKVAPHKTFMVQNELWEFTGLGTLTVCRSCFEEELGRAITISDLTECPMNDWLFLELLQNVSDEETGDGIPASLRTLIGTVPEGRSESMAIPGGWERYVAPNGARGQTTRPNRGRGRSR
jgi:hypothetical protein